MEIERKFLLSAPPPPEVIGKGEEIHQGYLLADKKGELRLRHQGDCYFLTVKGDGTLSREEWEIEAPKWVFNLLWPFSKGRRIEKTRFTVKDVEVDVYRGRLAGLIILEREFPDEQAVAAFRLPEWAADAVEVTANQAYKNKNLAVHGLPKGG